MADGLNRVQLLGNLGAEPELRATGGGQAVLKLRLACAEKYKDRDGEWKERTEWVSVTLWGKRGEALAKILSKGDRIFVEGSLRTSSYEKDNEKRYRTEVNATNVILCGGRRGEDDGAGSSRGGRGRSQSSGGAPPSAPADDFGGGDDSEIPF